MKLRMEGEVWNPDSRVLEMDLMTGMITASSWDLHFCDLARLLTFVHLHHCDMLVLTWSL